MTDAVETGLRAALERIEVHGEVTDAWLRRRHPSVWREIRAALELEAELNGGLNTRARIGPFTILRALGAGGMGSVYLARSGDGDARVAIKLLHPRFAHDPRHRRRFLREAEVGLRVVHPSVVRLHGAHTLETPNGPVQVLSMEYLEGRTLQQRLDAETCLSEPECLRIGVELCAALEAVHAVGVVHRDVKPRNVIELASGRLKLLDLGLAWVQEERARLSRTGEFVGSMLYAAPEQFGFGPGPVDARADLYSLGVSLFQLATGRLPWSESAVERRYHVPPLGLREIAPGHSPAFDLVVGALLARDPADRPRSAAAVAAELEGCRSQSADGTETGARPPSQPALDRALRVRRQFAAVCTQLETVRAGSGRALLIDAPDAGDADRWWAWLAGHTDRAERVQVVDLEGGGRRATWDVVARQLGADAACDPASDTGFALERRRHAALDAAARLARGAVAILVLRGPADDAVAEVFTALAALCAEMRLLVVWTAAGAEAAPWAAELSRAPHVVLESSCNDAGAAARSGRAKAAEPLPAPSDPDRALLSALVILGGECDPGALAEMLVRPPLDVLRALTRLEREHGLVEWEGERCRIVMPAPARDDSELSAAASD